MQARFYAPMYGRFLSPDPARDQHFEETQSWNIYSYVQNNPTMKIDPDGESLKDAISGFVAGVKSAPGRLARSIGAAYSSAARHPLQAAIRYSPAGAAVAALKGQVESTKTAWSAVLNPTHETGKQLGAEVGQRAIAAATGLVGEGAAGLASGSGITNPIPSTMARVIPDGIPATTLGRPGAPDVMVTGASDISGMNAAQIANRLTIPSSPNGFQVIEFKTPQSGVASPVFRSDPGFVGGGKTAGGAREFVIPNQTIPADATIRKVN